MVTFSFAKRELVIVAIFLAVSFIVRVLLFPLQGYLMTLTILLWFNTAATHGIRPFYTAAGFVDYPPFNVYIFWAFGCLANGVSND